MPSRGRRAEREWSALSPPWDLGPVPASPWLTSSVPHGGKIVQAQGAAACIQSQAPSLAVCMLWQIT